MTINIHSVDTDWPAWIQIILTTLYIVATAIGTYFIAKSFYNQNIVNEKQADLLKQQIELNSISLRKHIRDIRPIFTIEEVDLTASKYKLLLINAMAKNIKIEQYDERHLLLHTRTNTGAYPNLFSHEFSSKTNLFDRAKFSDVLIIAYEDEEERKYKQVVHLQNNNMTISFPRLNEEESVSDTGKR